MLFDLFSNKHNKYFKVTPVLCIKLDYCSGIVDYLIGSTVANYLRHFFFAQSEPLMGGASVSAVWLWHRRYNAEKKRRSERWELTLNTQQKKGKCLEL